MQFGVGVTAVFYSRVQQWNNMAQVTDNCKHEFDTILCDYQSNNSKWCKHIQYHYPVILANTWRQNIYVVQIRAVFWTIVRNAYSSSDQYYQGTKIQGTTICYVSIRITKLFQQIFWFNDFQANCPQCHIKTAWINLLEFAKVRPRQAIGQAPTNYITLRWHYTAVHM